jgi:hypothetical protein
MAMSIYSCASILVQTSTITWQTPDADWAIAILSISLIFSLATVFAHLVFPEIFVGPSAEGAATILLLLAWITCFPMIVGPESTWSDG